MSSVSHIELMSNSPASSVVRVLNVVASINRDTGGPANSVTALADATALPGFEPMIASLDYSVLGPKIETRKARQVSIPAGFWAQQFRGWSPQFERTLAENTPDIIHNHGLWMAPNVYARRLALKRGIPLITSPRGMLEPWAVKRRRLTKALASILYERANLQAVAMFHATSAGEYTAIRAAGWRQPVALIPNGVHLADHVPRASDEKSKKKQVLFMSRLHPKKGLDVLIQAWAMIQPRYPEWQLLIVGPDLTGYSRHVKRQIGALAPGANIKLGAALYGRDKWQALAQASLFVLPTLSENFGLVIAEALYAGTPVVTTAATPWAGIEDRGCGWLTPVEPAMLAATIQSALALSHDERIAMGRRGSAWIAAEFSWAAVGQRMCEAYAWLLQGGQRPSFIDVGA